MIPDFVYGDTYTISFLSKISDNSGNAYKYAFSHDVYQSNPSIAILFIEDGVAGADDTVCWACDDAANDEYLISDVSGGDKNACDGSWHKITIVRVRDSGSRIRIDGVEQGTDLSNDTSYSPVGPIFIGVREDLDSDRFFGGYLDEIMISSTERNNDWDAAEWESQRDHLLDFGEEEINEVNSVFFGCNF